MPDLSYLGKVITRRVIAAHMIGASLVFAYATLVGQRPADQAPDSTTPWTDGALVAGYLVAAVVVGGVLGNRAGDRMAVWLQEQRPPTAEELRATLNHPWHEALRGSVWWLGAAVFFGFLHWRSDHTVGQSSRLGIAILLGGLVVCSLTFLLVERALRPMFALALAGGPSDRPRTLGVRHRLMLSWLLGSGVPLLAIAVAPLGRGGISENRLLIAMALLGAMGLLAGAVFTAVAAHAVADPLRDVRRALGRVQEGDLAVRLPVDDGGEVGLVQAGFNRMTAGLEERQRLRDLFGRHVGAEVARRALEQGSGLGGEQRDASVLFVDLVGSTAIAEVLPPNEVVATLNVFFDAVVRVVSGEGGWVNKFEGDGALCVFGAPSTQPDHAARALRAARSLHLEVEALAASHPGLDAGIGVSSGAVVAGNVGTEVRYEYTVVGRPVNEAARLTELAKGRSGRVVASEAAVSRAGDEATRWGGLGTTALRGQTAPTALFEPVPVGQPVR